MNYINLKLNVDPLYSSIWHWISTHSPPAFYYPTAVLNCYLSGVTELSVCIECSFNSIKRTLWCDDVIITLFLSMVNNDNFFCVITNNIWGLNMVKKWCFAKQAIGQISEELWRFCWFIYSELTSLKIWYFFGSCQRNKHE